MFNEIIGIYLGMALIALCLMGGTIAIVYIIVGAIRDYKFGKKFEKELKKRLKELTEKQPEKQDEIIEKEKDDEFVGTGTKKD